MSEIGDLVQQDIEREKQRALYLLRLAGMKYEICVEVPGTFTWNGSLLRIWNLTASEILHELGHYLVAGKFRQLPEYGVGTDPNGYHRIRIVASEDHDPDEAEAQASLMGIILEKAIGLPWKKTLDLHSWFSDDEAWLEGKRNRDAMGSEAQKVASELRKKKLIERTGARPTLMRKFDARAM